MGSSASAAALGIVFPRLPISSSSLHRNLRLPLLIPSSSSLLPSLKTKTIPPHRLLSLSLASSPRPRLFCASSSYSPLLVVPSSSAALHFNHDDQPNSNSQFVVHDDELQKEQEEQEAETEAASEDVSHQQQQLLPKLASPKLSVKERKELASYAHSLGKNKKLKSQQVGKSGVTPSVATSFLETLEANELLKLKIHGSCPGELTDVIKQLEEATGSVAIDQIGRSVILYRPSPSRMKKREAASLRKLKEYPTSKTQKKAHTPRS